MKNFFLIFSIDLLASNIFAETERNSYKIVVDKFVRFYNEGQPNSIFSQFSVEMREVLPREKTHEFVKGLK